MPLPTSSARQTPNSSPIAAAPQSRWQEVWGSPRWMVLIAFAVRVLWIVVAHTYRIRTTEHNFGFGFETGRIAYSLANGMGFSSPFGATLDRPRGPLLFIPGLFRWPSGRSAATRPRRRS